MMSAVAPIAIVAEGFLPNHTGGDCVVASSMAMQLQKAGFTVVPIAVPVRKASPDVGRLRRRLRDLKVDLVICHTPWAVEGLEALQRDAVVVYQRHVDCSEYVSVMNRLEAPIDPRSAAYIARDADMVAAADEVWMVTHPSDGMAQQRLRIVPPFIDVAEIDRVARRRGPPAYDLVVGGRLDDPAKGIARFLSWYRHGGRGRSLLVLGSAVDIETSAVTQRRWVRDRHDCLTAMASARCYVSTSYCETLGLQTMEAAMLGCSIVTTVHGAVGVIAGEECPEATVEEGVDFEQRLDAAIERALGAGETEPDTLVGFRERLGRMLASSEELGAMVTSALDGRS